MANILGGYIIDSFFHKNIIEKEKVQFEINIETHYITIQFEDDIYIENDNHPINYVFLLDAYEKKLTMLDCYIEEQSARKVKILFSTIILGLHNQQFDILNPSSVCFEIGSAPVPLLNVHLPKGITALENINIEIKDSKGGLNDVDLMITPTTEAISLDDLETVFFNVMDIYFLCLGFYPYIQSEKLMYRNHEIYIDRLQFSKYKKGCSYAHWSTILASGTGILLEKAYPKFCLMLDRNKIIIKALTNAIYSSDLIIDFTLSILIQCVEGYIREWHKWKKFSNGLKHKIRDKLVMSLDDFNLEKEKNADGKPMSKEDLIESIKGLLGDLNSPSLGECLEKAFNINDYTKMILNEEIENESYDDFISKSKGTRNQFSHMTPQKNRFSNVYEIVMAKEKYVLLLRLIMLNDLGIQINGDLKRYIDNINSNYLTQIKK